MVVGHLKCCKNLNEMFLWSVAKQWRTCCQLAIPIEHGQPQPQCVRHVNLSVLAKTMYIHRILECEISVHI